MYANVDNEETDIKNADRLLKPETFPLLSLFLSRYLLNTPSESIKRRHLIFN